MDAAYSKAGYDGSRKHASRLGAKEDIQARLESLQTMYAAAASVSVEFVLEGLVRNYHRAMVLEEVRDRKGEPTGELTYNGAVANKALELLGKHFGMFQVVEADAAPEETGSEQDKELLRKLGVKDIADARQKRASG